MEHDDWVSLLMQGYKVGPPPFGFISTIDVGFMLNYSWRKFNLLVPPQQSGMFWIKYMSPIIS